MKYIDLFAGIGGFHYGIDQAYRRLEDEQQADMGLRTEESEGKHNTRTRVSLPERHLRLSGNGTCADCVYSNEWDKYANSVYRRHYGECDNRDIRTVKSSEIPDFDLLCGGFPCQAFSVAGKRGGFDDTRGTLFFEVARILKEKQPRLLVLENVKGLLSHDSGRTFKVILATLTELGYDVQWQVLNSKNFGVPQNRERVFIVGHLRGTTRPEIFPITGTNKENPIKGFYRQPLRYLDRNQKEISGDYGYALDGSGTWGISDGDKIRRLTPTECARLQGFPDDWCDLGAEGETISDTQKYKMAGNAVTTNVVTAVMERLLTHNTQALSRKGRV
jgi:DNA (cytosine-5)-methyltransferase 1